MKRNEYPTLSDDFGQGNNWKGLLHIIEYEKKRMFFFRTLYLNKSCSLEKCLQTSRGKCPLRSPSCPKCDDYNTHHPPSISVSTLRSTTSFFACTSLVFEWSMVWHGGYLFCTITFSFCKRSDLLKWNKLPVGFRTSEHNIIENSFPERTTHAGKEGEISKENSSTSIVIDKLLTIFR